MFNVDNFYLTILDRQTLKFKINITDGYGNIHKFNPSNQLSGRIKELIKNDKLNEYQILKKLNTKIQIEINLMVEKMNKEQLQDLEREKEFRDRHYEEPDNSDYYCRVDNYNEVDDTETSDEQ